MINQIYRLLLTDDAKLDFYVDETINCVSNASELEMFICVLGKDGQLDGFISDAQLESLIQYLTDCKTYIDKFNKNAKVL